MNYKILLEQRVIGNAEVEKRGLFYLVRCICRFPTETKCRIIMHCETKSIDLGICVPEKDTYTLKSNIPINRIGNGKLRFTVQLHQQEDTIFHPIDPQRRFDDITKLLRAKYMEQDHVPGVLI